MIFLFIIAFALLAATAYTFYRRQHASSDYHAQLESRFISPRSLFDHEKTRMEGGQMLAAQTNKEAEERNAALLKRSLEGDLTTLAEARRAGDSTLYGKVLGGLLEWAAASEADLRSLASFIANDPDLRGNHDLAAAYDKIWQQNPDRQSTAQKLHLAALSDEAATFERAIEATCDFMRTGRLDDLRPEELSTLIESEYWVLSSEARRTGAGFVLKQRMNILREELATGRKTESPKVESKIE